MVRTVLVRGRGIMPGTARHAAAPGGRHRLPAPVVAPMRPATLAVPWMGRPGDGRIVDASSVPAPGKRASVG